MFIQSSRSLSFMLFNRPISILARACNVPRVKAASKKLGTHIYHPSEILSYSSDTKPPQPHQNKTTSSLEPSTETRPPAQSQAPTDKDMEGLIRNFSQLGTDDKLAHIQEIRNALVKEKSQLKPAVYETLMTKLDMKEKEIKDADRWYYQAARSIAWGPLIVFEAAMALLSS